MFQLLCNLFLSFFGIVRNSEGNLQIETAYVDMFHSNVFHLAQQKVSKLLPYVRQESQKGESSFYDRIGSTEMDRMEGHNSDVQYSDIDHSRRMVTTEPFYKATLVDDVDKLKVIMNPENAYSQAHGMALGRQYDTTIIEGLIGNAYGGRRGTTAVALPSTQTIAAFDGTATTGTGLNIATLKAVKKKFAQNEAMGFEGNLVFVCAAQQIDDLLGITEVTSADYNTVRALAAGDVDTYMGFKFVRTELLTRNSGAITYNKDSGLVGSGTGTIADEGSRKCIAFVPNSALLLAVGEKHFSRVSEIANKHYSNQIYTRAIIGSTRMEEVQVVVAYCKEA